MSSRRCAVSTPSGCATTLDRFNPNAKQGVDPEFHTGEGAYNQYLGDPKWKPNNCLAPIEKGPFYASAVYPGDVGTCGGILTDENAAGAEGLGGDDFPPLRDGKCHGECDGAEVSRSWGEHREQCGVRLSGGTARL